MRKHIPMILACLIGVGITVVFELGYLAAIGVGATLGVLTALYEWRKR